jgi:hypothetical protein
VVVTQASFPNLQSFGKSSEFCLIHKKIVRSCLGDRRPTLDIIYPNLCNITLAYAEDTTEHELECNPRKMDDEPKVMHKIYRVSHQHLNSEHFR